MGIRRDEFEIGEWYHIFNRGVEKRIVFAEKADYERYVQLLYLCNSKDVIHRSDITTHSTHEITCIPRGNPLVGIGAFCLMPNHFHMLIKETRAGGISAFMQKLGTAYTMYFNIKNERAGNLFVKPFHSKHIADDRYFQRAIQYIHCNPAELREPGWKRGIVRDIKKLEQFLTEYPYSSLGDHANIPRPTRTILDPEIFEMVDDLHLNSMLKEARAYYEEHFLGME